MNNKEKESSEKVRFFLNTFWSILYLDNNFFSKSSSVNNLMRI